MSLIALMALVNRLIGLVTWVVVGAVGAVTAFVRRRRGRVTAVVAMATIVGCSAVVVPTVVPDAVPAWANDAESLTVYSSNLYWTNDHIDEAMALALGSGADVVVFIEFTPEFEAPLRRSGLLDAYPSLVRSGADATNILLARGPVVSTRIAGSGWNSLPVATVRSGSTDVTVVGVHTRGPHDLSDLGGWSRDVAGVGDAASDDPWPIRGIPVLGIDHALSRGDVVPLGVEEVDVPGSDHRAIEVTYAVR